MTHIISDAPHGADCSCGRKFSIWGTGNTYVAMRAMAHRNLARANARRHADAANRKEAAT